MSTSLDEMIEHYGHYCTDPRNDGFSQFEAKKKIYLALWEAHKWLDRAPKFIGETEWLQEHGHTEDV